jgi:hypothetical protein
LSANRNTLTNNLAAWHVPVWQDIIFIQLGILAEKIKKGLDNFFGPTWHVIIGEDFTFNIDYEANLVHYMVYGSHAILAWKVSCPVS